MLFAIVCNLKFGLEDSGAILLANVWWVMVGQILVWLSQMDTHLLLVILLMTTSLSGGDIIFTLPEPAGQDLVTGSTRSGQIYARIVAT